MTSRCIFNTLINSKSSAVYLSTCAPLLQSPYICLPNSLCQFFQPALVYPFVCSLYAYQPRGDLSTGHNTFYPLVLHYTFIESLEIRGKYWGQDVPQYIYILEDIVPCCKSIYLAPPPPPPPRPLTPTYHEVKTLTTIPILAFKWQEVKSFGIPLFIPMIQFFVNIRTILNGNQSTELLRFFTGFFIVWFPYDLITKMYYYF